MGRLSREVVVRNLGATDCPSAVIRYVYAAGGEHHALRALRALRARAETSRDLVPS